MTMTAAYDVLAEGFIYQCPGSEEAGATVTSRCVVTDTGVLLSSFMTQTKLGSNDFVPCLAESVDGGVSWRMRGPIWPHLRDWYSINASISRSPTGELLLFGSRTPRNPDVAEESFWCQETLGILQNQMIWSRSTDGGKTWLDPQPVDIPLTGAAEVPAPICATDRGRWVAPYSPHNTFDPDLEVDLRHVVTMISDDEGATWRHLSAIRVNEDDAYVAEAWVTQLSSGALLATAWHLSRSEGDDYPNVYALSTDGGDSWGPTRSTGIPGQSAGLAPLPNGKVLMAYNQRRHGAPGVKLAIAQPTVESFNLIADDYAWQATIPSQNQTSGKSTQWTDFAFGEPGVTVLPDGSVLVLMWCIQPDGAGVRFVKLRVD